MLFPISFNIAAALGPVLGGQLADLGSRFPDTYGHSQFLTKWPYAPPAIANGVLMLISLTLVFFFLEEVSFSLCDYLNLTLEYASYVEKHEIEDMMADLILLIDAQVTPGKI